LPDYSEAHKLVLGASTRTDKLDIYVADSLVDYEPHTLQDVSKFTLTRVASTLSGDNPSGLAQVLLGSVLGPGNVSELVSLLSTSLNLTILNPEQAAALITCINHSEEDIERIQNIPKELIYDIELLPKGASLETFDDSDKSYTGVKYINRYSLDHGVDELIEYLSKADPQLRGILDKQERLVDPNKLSSKFFVQRQSTGIYIPPKQRILVARTMQEAVEKAEKDRSSLLNMSPRKFEEFMAYMFSQLGFQVELTKTSRDGGADLICMQSKHGIPFRLAVEVKRYKENRPVTVSLIRAFVGANREFHANHLLFVTTSRYTQPAKDYATDYAAHLLSLKDYEQIKEWCSIVRANPPSLFQ